ncbi:MAG: putative tagatose-6-phosphate ketose/aldose isomerase [Candidatus Atribacteria bacterium ADurb.Bin276]|uniref:Putative tagatose-6-phosphate ketose/aldose isomerase n=1 Tax=Candidatus Atribacter allofermentans TaxID=1852833 RepID=A0A1V5SK98_9BACT|nr:MAG: putative tagatose-6-phosphate ketose/aldose isomerase [Candidatus Atribacteria bacterium ADurb.Bin276]
MNPLSAFISLDDTQKEALGIQYTPQEIHDQVDLWTSSVERVFQYRQRLIELFESLSGKKKSVIYLAGAGTSEFVGYCLQGIFRQSFPVPVQVVSTGKLVTHPFEYFAHTNPLMISFARSGDSPESWGAYEIASQFSDSICHLVITCNKEGGLARRARHDPNSLVIDLDEKTNDRGLAMTASFSNMVIAGQACSQIYSPDEYTQKLPQLVVAGRKVLAMAPEVVKKIAESDFQRAVFLGSGSHFGTAIESHLKLQELTSGQIMCGYNTFLDVRHGPKAVIDKHTLVVAFLASDPYVRRYEAELLKEIRQQELGKMTILIGEGLDDEISRYGDEMIDIKSDSQAALPDSLTPPVYVMIGQLLGLFKSLHLGFKPDSPSKTGVIHRVVQGVKVYDPKIFKEKGIFQEIKG